MESRCPGVQHGAPPVAGTQMSLLATWLRSGTCAVGVCRAASVPSRVWLRPKTAPDGRPGVGSESHQGHCHWARTHRPPIPPYQLQGCPNGLRPPTGRQRGHPGLQPLQGLFRLLLPHLIQGPQRHLRVGILQSGQGPCNRPPSPAVRHWGLSTALLPQPRICPSVEEGRREVLQTGAGTQARVVSSQGPRHKPGVCLEPGT